jgi:hypothetical protein
MTQDTKSMITRRKLLMRLALGAGAVYVAPSVAGLDVARASGGSGKGSGGSGKGSGGSGKGSGPGAGRSSGGRSSGPSRGGKSGRERSSGPSRGGRSVRGRSSGPSRSGGWSGASRNGRDAARLGRAQVSR